MNESNIMTCLSNKGNIIFEAETHLKGGFITGKKYHNSRYLETGENADMLFNKDYCRTANPKEVERFTALKQNSEHLIAVI